MKLSHLTFTGADNAVNPVALEEISIKHRLVEWAILFSDKLVGSERYPSHAWRDEFYRKSPTSNKAAHLCGGNLLRRFVDFEPSLMNELANYKRVQLNFNAERHELLFVIKLISAVDSKRYKHHSGAPIQFITQHNKSNSDITERFKTNAVLFDGSGGLGLSPENWDAPIASKLCGYAGGLGPENIALEMHKIHEAAGEDAVWIDMESKLRTGGQLDLEKVNSVISSVDSYLKNC